MQGCHRVLGAPFAEEVRLGVVEALALGIEKSVIFLNFEPTSGLMPQNRKRPLLFIRLRFGYLCPILHHKIVERVTCILQFTFCL